MDNGLCLPRSCAHQRYYRTTGPHTHTHTHTHTLTLIGNSQDSEPDSLQAHTHTHPHNHTHSHTHPLTHPPHTHTPTHTHTHTHTLTLFPSFRLSPFSITPPFHPSLPLFSCLSSVSSTVSKLFSVRCLHHSLHFSLLLSPFPAPSSLTPSISFIPFSLLSLPSLSSLPLLSLI